LATDAPTAERRMIMWTAFGEYLHQQKPKTNADRIRAMSDEELAEEFHAIMLGWNEWCDYHCENRGDDGCDKCILKWLKQPAEGE
jgi:hypothetical protein